MVGSDDFMGSAEFDLTSMEFNKSQEVTLYLEDAGDEDLIRFVTTIASLQSEHLLLIFCKQLLHI